MGLLDKFDKAMDKGRKLVRDAQDAAERTAGEGVRAATAQSGGSLASVEGGRDVFAPLVAAANNLGFAYVARSESLDAAGYTLHSNRHGLHVDGIDLNSGGERVTVEALNRPVASLLEWEAVRLLLSDGEQEDVQYQQIGTTRQLTHQSAQGWQSSMLFRRMVVRVRYEGPQATEHLARDFVRTVVYHHLDRQALDSWLAEHGVNGDIDLATEPLAGKFTVKPAAPPAPARLQVTVPDATAVAATAIAADDPTRRFHDWDHFQPGAEVVGFTTARRSVVRTGPWEGVAFEGEHGEFAHALAAELPAAVADPQSWGNLLLESQQRPAPFDGCTIFVGLDAYGYPAAHGVIGDTTFLVRLFGPAGHLGGYDAAHRLACAAVEAMPG